MLRVHAVGEFAVAQIIIRRLDCFAPQVHECIRAVKPRMRVQQYPPPNPRLIRLPRRDQRIVERGRFVWQYIESDGCELAALQPL